MDRVVAHRAAHGDERFYDIDFRAMQADPIAEVRALYEWLGEPVSDDFAAGMASWWQHSQESREPARRPTPQRSGSTSVRSDHDSPTTSPTPSAG